MKKRMSFYLSAMSILAGVGLSSVVQAQSITNTEPYKDVFISYYSPADVAAMAKYAEQKQLGGFILWEFRGDMPYDDKQKSLLAQLPASMNGSAPMVMGYWTNWSVYTDTPDRAIPQPAYPVPGSLDHESGSRVANPDFSQKLDGMNVVTYAFLEAQTSTKNKAGEIGKLYFSDPWADLQQSGSDAQDRLCGKGPDPQNMSVICTFAWKTANIADNQKMGNFNAFAKLTHNGSKYTGGLKRVFSVAGYGHNDVFEDTFGNPTYINNFVTSAKQIIDAYGLDGIDLDYENPKMTHAQSSQYLELIKELRNALQDKFISVTILSDPDYLNGKRDGDRGFAPAVLKEIADNVNHINLMTYDFHGAFDYISGGKGTTGFLTNLHKPDDAPPGYKFSVDTSVQAALDLGISAKMISVGIPAYGRAIAGIDSADGGLFQLINKSPVGVIPKGDLDPKDCTTEIPLSTTSCSGSFRYSYILNNMVGHGFEVKEHTADGVSNGVTAYAAQWTPPPPPPPPVVHRLTIVNKSSVGFNVTVKNEEASFTAPEFFNPQFGKTYEPASINNQKGLNVFVKAYWSGEERCNLSALDFTSDMRINVLAVVQGGGATCVINK